MTTLAAPRAATGPTHRTAIRAGQVVTALVSAFLLFDAVIHVLNIPPVVEGSRTLGFDPDVMPYLGVLVWAGLYLRDQRVRDLVRGR